MLFVVWSLALPVLYVLPAIVGFIRKKRNKWAIFLLDPFHGRTVIAWIVAMVWALGDDTPDSTQSAG
jgi:hypothetical protein